MRQLGWSLVCVTAMQLVAGCGSQDGNAAGGLTTITFLRHDNPNYRKADNEFFSEYMAAHPGVKIVDTTVDFHTLHMMLIGDLKRDQFAFDLVLVPPSRVCGFAANLTEVPASIISLAQAQNTFFAAPLEGSTCDGKLKGLPVEYNLEYGGVVVNVDKYQQKFAGKLPNWSTWDQFIDEAAALTEYDEAGRPMANGLDLDPHWAPATREIFLSQILQRGGSYWAGDGTFNFMTPAARESLAAMVEWMNVKKIMFRALIPDRNTHVTTRLAAGATGYGWSHPSKPLSVMGYLGTAGVPSTTVQLPPGSTWRFDYFPVPPMVGTEHRFVQDSGWAFAVPRSSKHPAVAWDIARSLALSPAAMRRWSSITGALPALKENGTMGAAQANPTLARVQPLLERGRWIGFIPVGAFETVAGTIPNNFFAAVSGSKTIEQALRDMQEAANTAIRQNGEN